MPKVKRGYNKNKIETNYLRNKQYRISSEVIKISIQNYNAINNRKRSVIKIRNYLIYYYLMFILSIQGNIGYIVKVNEKEKCITSWLESDEEEEATVRKRRFVGTPFKV